MSLVNKKILILGGSRNIGRAISIKASEKDADVFAVARNKTDLIKLKNEYPKINIISLDLTENVANKLLSDVQPDIIIHSGGALPLMNPIHEFSFEEFSVHWLNDVKISFDFIKAALKAPMARDTKFITISSGAAVGGSPLSGGYGASKRAQMFLTDYAAKLSEATGNGIIFKSLAPLRMVENTEIGNIGIKGYAQSLGVSEDVFKTMMTNPPTIENVANAVFELIENSDNYEGTNYGVTSVGIDKLS